MSEDLLLTPPDLSGYSTAERRAFFAGANWVAPQLVGQISRTLAALAERSIARRLSGVEILRVLAAGYADCTPFLDQVERVHDA